MKEYLGGFDNWSDVLNNFKEPESLEPEIVVAYYDDEDYDGNAVVLFKQFDEYGWVEGSHCSCYGLEGQWEPELYDKDMMISVLNRVITNKGRYSKQCSKFLEFITKE